MKIHKQKVKLSIEEREKLESILKKGVHTAKKVTRVNILLHLENLNNWQTGPKYKPTIESIALKCGVSPSTVYKVINQYIERGIEGVLTRKKRETPPIQPIITGEIEARIIALACSEPPEGYSRWTLRLLENKVVELGIVEKISDNTIGRMLKKTNSSPN